MNYIFLKFLVDMFNQRFKKIKLYDNKWFEQWSGLDERKKLFIENFQSFYSINISKISLEY